MAEKLIIKTTVDADFVINYLSRNGFKEEDVVVRESKDSDLATRVMETGTDRDETSEIFLKESMGIKLSAEKLTYAEPLSSFLAHGFCAMINGRMYLFYDQKKLKIVSDNKWEPIRYLYTPRDGSSFKDALIAVAVMDIPNLQKLGEKRKINTWNHSR